MRTEDPTQRKTFTALFVSCFAMVLWFVCPPATASTAAPEDLADLSLERLMDIEVTSVSKRAQKMSEVAAAITVITAEDIRRSGATNIPEALRLVPGLHVAHIDGSKWAITSRGFNGVYANKLLVMIDGRSVYTPLYAGTYWEVQDVVLEDIDRIEVIRGPGGTIWGANAVNGVINILTKESKDTDGLLVSGGGGSLEDGIAALRYGHGFGDDLHVRGYFKYLHTDQFDPATLGGTDAADARRIHRVGARADWDVAEGTKLTVQGDYYNGESEQGAMLGTADVQEVSGGNMLVRLQSAIWENSDVTAQLYYDRTERTSSLIDSDRNTIDADVQFGFAGFPRQIVTVGTDYRLIWDDLGDIGSFDPMQSTDHMISGFIQDKIGVLPEVFAVTIGSKFEYNQFSEFEFQPSLRLLWTPTPRHTAWSALSRAVRTPSRIDSDFTLVPIGYWLTSGRHIDAEDLLAFELGYRGQPHDRVSVDLTAYLNKYDDLRSTECNLYSPLVPVCIDGEHANKLDGLGWGVEATGTWTVFDFWKLVGSYTYMALDLEADGDSIDTRTPAEERNTPLHQFQIRSQLDLPWNLEADAALYYVGELKNLDIDSYWRVDVRFGWQPTENIELSVLGRNLQERRHLEYGTATYTYNSSVPRSIFAELVLRY